MFVVLIYNSSLLVFAVVSNHSSSFSFYGRDIQSFFMIVLVTKSSSSFNIS